MQLPAFKKMRHFTVWRDLIADAIWVYINHFHAILRGEYRVMRMNHLPDASNNSRFILSIHVAARDFSLLGYTFGPASSFRCLLVILVGINKLGHSSNTLCLSLAHVQKHTNLSLRVIYGC